MFDLGGLLSAATTELTNGTTVEISSNIGGGTISLVSDGSPPNPIVKLIKPRVRLVKDGTVIIDEAPYGQPGSPLLFWIGVAAAIVALIGLFIFLT